MQGTLASACAGAAAANPPPPAPPSAQASPSTGECAPPKSDRQISECAKKQSGIKTESDATFPLLEDRSGDKVVLWFDEEGQPLTANPLVDENDDVWVVVVVRKPGRSLKEVKVTACETPRVVRIHNDAGQKFFEDMDAELRKPDPGHDFAIVHASSCSSDSGLKLTVVRRESETGPESSADITIKTLPLYRVFVALGLIFDFVREREYRAAVTKGENVPTIVRDDKLGGLTVVPMILIPFAPADTVRVRRPFQSFGPAVGFSFSDPTDHLYLGLHFAPWPGLGLIAGWHFRREAHLAGGFAEGDRVPNGTVATDKRWAKPGFDDVFVGLEADSSVIASVLQGLRK